MMSVQEVMKKRSSFRSFFSTKKNQLFRDKEFLFKKILQNDLSDPRII